MPNTHVLVPVFEPEDAAPVEEVPVAVADEPVSVEAPVAADVAPVADEPEADEPELDKQLLSASGSIRMSYDPDVTN